MQGPLRLPNQRINPAGRPLTEEEVQNIVNIARRTAQGTPTARDSEGTAFAQNQLGTNLGITLGSQIGAQLAQALPQAMDAAVMPALGREIAIGMQPIATEVANASSAAVGELRPAADALGAQIGNGIYKGLSGVNGGGVVDNVAKTFAAMAVVLTICIAVGVAFGVVVGRYVSREK